MINAVIEPGRQLRPREKLALLDAFNRRKAAQRENNMEPFTWPFVLRNGSDSGVSLTAQEVEECFWRALKEPVGLAESLIKHAAQVSEGNCKVVVTGKTHTYFLCTYLSSLISFRWHRSPKVSTRTSRRPMRNPWP